MLRSALNYGRPTQKMGGLQQAAAPQQLTQRSAQGGLSQVGAPQGVSYNPNAPVMESKIGWLHSEDQTGYMEDARRFNEDLLKVPGLVTSKGETIGANDSNTGQYSPNYFTSAYIDPWTGKLVKNVGVSYDFEQGHPGSDGANNGTPDQYIPMAPWESSYKFGVKGEALTPEEMFTLIPESERGTWQQRYNDLQTKRSKFEEQYIPTTLKGQVSQFLPKDEVKYMFSDGDYASNVLTANLASRGIRDLNQVGVTRDATGQQVFFDKATGTPLNSAMHTFKGGSNDGNLSYGLAVNPQGQVYITNKFKKPEKTLMDDYLPMVALAAATAATGGAMGTALGGAGATAGGAAGGTTGAAMGSTAGNALGYGLASGTASAMQGGDFMQGFGAGALTGGLGHGAGQLVRAYNPGAMMFTNPLYAGIANNAIKGGLTSAGQAAFRGGDPFETGLTGLISGGLNSGLSQYGQSLGLSPTLANQAAGFGTKYMMNQMRPRKT